MVKPKHNCPACGCYFGTMGLVGGRIPGTNTTVEGLIHKNLRLAKEIRLVKEENKRLRKGRT